jgi:hypothetical protein
LNVPGQVPPRPGTRCPRPAALSKQGEPRAPQGLALAFHELRERSGLAGWTVLRRSGATPSRAGAEGPHRHRVQPACRDRLVLSEPLSRLELETYGLRNRCSTTELKRRFSCEKGGSIAMPSRICQSLFLSPHIYPAVPASRSAFRVFSGAEGRRGSWAACPWSDGPGRPAL